MRQPAWVAEEPEAHLLPHLEQACESLPFRILDTHVSDDGTYELELAWTGGEAGVGVIRALVFSLLGAIAEPASYVRQRRTDADGSTEKVLLFEVVTGIVEEAPFKAHGHTLRLVVRTLG